MKIASRIVMAILGLLLAGLAFLYFSPGHNLYMVRSESMRPTIDMGDVIITGPLSSKAAPEVGTIITYEYKSELVTHRVFSIDGQTLKTKGDAVEDPDPWTVNLTDVRGVYLFKIPCVGYVTSFIRTRLGWFLTIIIPAALLVGWLAKDIVKEALSDA